MGHLALLGDRHGSQAFLSFFLATKDRTEGSRQVEEIYPINPKVEAMQYSVRSLVGAINANFPPGRIAEQYDRVRTAEKTTSPVGSVYHWLACDTVAPESAALAPSANWVSQLENPLMVKNSNRCGVTQTGEARRSVPRRSRSLKGSPSSAPGRVLR